MNATVVTLQVEQQARQARAPCDGGGKHALSSTAPAAVRLDAPLFVYHEVNFDTARRLPPYPTRDPTSKSNFNFNFRFGQKSDKTHTDTAEWVRGDVRIFKKDRFLFF